MRPSWFQRRRFSESSSCSRRTFHIISKTKQTPTFPATSMINVNALPGGGAAVIVQEYPSRSAKCRPFSAFEAFGCPGYRICGGADRRNAASSGGHAHASPACYRWGDQDRRYHDAPSGCLCNPLLAISQPQEVFLSSSF